MHIESAPSSSTKKTLLVIGHGMVSHRFCETVSQLGGLAKFNIIVLAEEDVVAYDRVHLGTRLEHLQASIQLTDEDWYRAHDIELRLGDPAVSLDTSARRVVTRAGHTVSYDILVLATGARARIPEMPGIDAEGCFPYRTLADADRIRAAAEHAKRMVVIGGGLLGIECADALNRRGIDVSVVEASRSLMPRQLDAQSAEVLRALIEEKGIRVLTGVRLSHIERTTDDLTIVAEDELSLHADAVVVAAGVVPADELARTAGIECASRGGVVVNGQLRTSAEHVHAIGDCVSHRGVSPGLVAPGYEMADVLAERLCIDSDREFRGMEPDCRLKLAGVDVSVFGRFDMEAQVVQHIRGGSTRTLVLHSGRVVGATVVGPHDALADLQRAVATNRGLSSREQRAFSDNGSLPKHGVLPVVEWPDKALVCQCARVSRGKLSLSIGEGARDVEALTAATGAGSVCGSCIPLLGELVGSRVPLRPQRFSRLTALGSLAALLWLALLSLSPSVRAASSVRDGLHAVEQLWRSSLFRQLSGFSVVLLFLLGLTLSARKRIAWFRWGHFTSFRALHTWLGVASLAALALHTGMHLGHHMNRLLMTVFVIACLVGACTGLAAYLEGQGNVRAGVARGVLSRVHLWILWPLPPLLLFHILAAYYF